MWFSDLRWLKLDSGMEFMEGISSKNGAGRHDASPLQPQMELS
jgi:hypothetical protein